MPGIKVALWAEVVLAVIEQALPTETAAVAGVDVAKAPESPAAPLSKVAEKIVAHSKMPAITSKHFLFSDISKSYLPNIIHNHNIVKCKF